MEIIYERHLNWTNKSEPSPVNLTDEIDSSREPLESSGFEDETPESDFEEEQ